MYETLVKVLTEEFGLDSALLHPDATFRDLDLDSLSLTELAILMEDATGVRVEHMPPETTLAQAAQHSTPAGS
ncbi:acyl carrier protein [Streptomyces chryseus]